MDADSNKESQIFENFKAKVAQSLRKDVENISFADMLLLSMPLAAEQIKDEKIWKHFRNLTFENQDKLQF